MLTSSFVLKFTFFNLEKFITNRENTIVFCENQLLRIFIVWLWFISRLNNEAFKFFAKIQVTDIESLYFPCDIGISLRLEMQKIFLSLRFNDILVYLKVLNLWKYRQKYNFTCVKINVVMDESYWHIFKLKTELLIQLELNLIYGIWPA
jgi:hypothetical protein